MKRWPLPTVCRLISWFAVVGGLLITFFGCVGTTNGSGALLGVVMSLGGMMAFAAGLISLTLLACFAPATRPNPDTTSEPPVEAAAGGHDDR
jgi:hypothetical protein